MKTKLIVSLAVLSFANIAWAQGGLSIENVEKHMNANKWVTTQSIESQVTTQGNIEKFIVDYPQDALTEEDTNKLKQSYDGQV